MRTNVNGSGGAEKDVDCVLGVILSRVLPALIGVFRAANLSAPSTARLAGMIADAVASSLGLALASASAAGFDFEQGVAIRVILRRSAPPRVRSASTERLADVLFDRDGRSWDLVDLTVELDAAVALGRDVEIAVGQDLLLARLRISGKAATPGVAKAGPWYRYFVRRRSRP